MSRALFPPIPEETSRAARAIFGRSNIYLSIGNNTDELFDELVPFDPPESIRRSKLTLPMLFLVTIFQFVETLPDRRAANAIRERIDWKYALHLPLNYPGVEATSLCRFRKWLVTTPAALQNFQFLLTRLTEFMSFTDKDSSQCDARCVLKRLCTLNRMAEVWEAMNQALGILVTKQPEWLRFVSLPHWYERYSRYRNNWDQKLEMPGWEDFALAIGTDGCYLLEAVSKAEIPGLAYLPEIIALNQMWQEQYVQDEGRLQWRKDSCADCNDHLQM